MELYVQSLRVGSRVARMCTEKRAGRVHSVFRRSFNLRVDGELITVSGRDVGASRRTLLSAEADFTRLPVEVHMPCLLDSSGIHIGHLVFGVAGVARWQSPIAENTSGTPCPLLASRFKAALERLAPTAGSHTGGEHALLAGLGAPDTLHEAVEGLVGLGPGLTPAGDDLLLGFTAALNHFGPDAAHTARLHGAILQQLGRTTDVSAQLLRDAVGAHYHETLGRLLASLCAGGQGMEILLPRLLAVGASSGGDIAQGLCWGLQYAAGIQAPVQAKPHRARGARAEARRA